MKPEHGPMNAHCHRCIAMHRRAQQNEGAAKRYERMRTNLEAQLAMHIKALSTDRDYFRKQWTEALGLLDHAGVKWNWKDDGPTYSSQRLQTLVRRLIAERNSARDESWWQRMIRTALPKRSDDRG